MKRNYRLDTLSVICLALVPIIVLLLLASIAFLLGPSSPILALAALLCVFVASVVYGLMVGTLQRWYRGYAEALVRLWRSFCNGLSMLFPLHQNSHSSFAFYVPIPDRETGLTEVLAELRPLFPDAKLEPYRVELAMGGPTIPVVHLLLNDRCRLSREQWAYLERLPRRYTWINNS